MKIISIKYESKMSRRVEFRVLSTEDGTQKILINEKIIAEVIGANQEKAFYQGDDDNLYSSPIGDKIFKNVQEVYYEKPIKK